MPGKLFVLSPPGKVSFIETSRKWHQAPLPDSVYPLVDSAEPLTRPGVGTLLAFLGLQVPPPPRYLAVAFRHSTEEYNRLASELVGRRIHGVAVLGMLAKVRSPSGGAPEERFFFIPEESCGPTLLDTLEEL